MIASTVTPVILGLLSSRPRSGYEIKTVVDRSTRFFWAASYGQIYPELRRLESEGLIEGEDAPNGDRPRRVYRLTGSARAGVATARRTKARTRAIPRDAARDRRTAGHRYAVRRSRPALGHRVQRMGSQMVPGPTRTPERTDDDARLTAPSVRSILVGGVL